MLRSIRWKCGRLFQITIIFTVTKWTLALGAVTIFCVIFSHLRCTCLQKSINAPNDDCAWICYIFTIDWILFHQFGWCVFSWTISRCVVTLNTFASILWKLSRIASNRIVCNTQPTSGSIMQTFTIFTWIWNASTFIASSVFILKQNFHNWHNILKMVIFVNEKSFSKKIHMFEWTANEKKEGKSSYS